MRIGNLGPGKGNWNFAFEGQIAEVGYYTRSVSIGEVLIYAKNDVYISDFVTDILKKATSSKDIIDSAVKLDSFSEEGTRFQNNIHEMVKFLEKPDSFNLKQLSSLLTEIYDLPKSLEDFKYRFLMKEVISE